MSNRKPSILFDRKISLDENQRVEAEGIHNALRFLARECKTLGYTSTASLAQNAAEAVFLELAAAHTRDPSAGKKRKATPVRAIPKRAKLPRAVRQGFAPASRERP